MKTNKEIDELMDKAESEIQAVLNKYGLYLGMLYDDGVTITLNHRQDRQDGTTLVVERGAF